MVGGIVVVGSEELFSLGERGGRLGDQGRALGDCGKSGMLCGRAWREGVVVSLLE